MAFIYANTILAQNTYVVILDHEEIDQLRKLRGSDDDFSMLCDSILAEGGRALASTPIPVDVIHYEGLLNTNPLRIETTKSLHDMNRLTNLIYAGYIENNKQTGDKVKEYVFAWANSYLPDGNPINENKFVALIWAYHLYHDAFDQAERKLVDRWLKSIAIAEIQREHTPNNNWQAKRLKLVGLIGCLLEDEEMKTFAVEGFKTYINTSYFADSTSNDLRDRDALSYHLSGLKPCISAFINLSRLDSKFELYNYEGPDGGSVNKSIAYVIPYARGEKQHREWIHSKVKLDHERAAAGIPEYQPGIIFDPPKAFSAFEWAGYYNRELLDIIDELDNLKNYWVGTLNSQMIRTD